MMRKLHKNQQVLNVKRNPTIRLNGYIKVNTTEARVRKSRNKRAIAELLECITQQ